MHRRDVLRGLVASAPFFAGCSALSGTDGGNGNGTDNGTGDNGTTTTAATVRETATATATATTAAATATTAAATATPTAIPTRTSTATPSSTPRATVAVTAAQPTTGVPTDRVTTSGPPGAIFGTTIDLSPLTRYTNEVYPYSVKRPVGWTVDASDPTQVIFEPKTGFAQEQVVVIDGIRGISLDTLVSLLNDSFDRYFDEYRVVNRQNVTLSNGNLGAELGVEMTDSAFGGLVLRGKSVYTIANGTAYGVLLLVLDGAYTSMVEQSMTAIVESLTVRDRSTSRPL